MHRDIFKFEFQFLNWKIYIIKNNKNRYEIDNIKIRKRTKKSKIVDRSR